MDSPGSIPFWLNLDHSFSIPVHLSGSTTVPADSATRKSMRSGVFYKEMHATDIFKFVHTDGSPGTVNIDPDAKDEDKNHYEHFQTRLSKGDLVCLLQTMNLSRTEHAIVYCTGWD